MLRQAARKLAPEIAGGRAGLVNSHLQRLPFADATFHGIMVNQVLHHLGDPDGEAWPEHGRVFRQGINFFGELRPGALHGQEATEGLSLTQLEALRLVMEKEQAEEIDELSRGLPWLAIIGSISPLLGLMGTVIGVMNAFLGITAVGSANIAAVAPGVAQALITTVAGLAVAIPAVIAYNHFVAKLQLFTGELEGFTSEFIGTLAREGRI